MVISINKTTSLNGASEESLNKQVAHEQVRLLYEGLPLPLAGSAIVALFVFWILYSNMLVSQSTVVWLGMILSLVAVRVWGSWLYHRADIKQKNNSHWSLWYLVGVSLTGVVWGLLAWSAFPVDQPEMQAVIITVMLGIVYGGTSVLIYMWQAALSFTIGALGLLLLKLIAVGSSFSWMMTGMVLIFAVFMISSSLRAARITRQNIYLRLASVAREAVLHEMQQQQALHISHTTMAVIGWNERFEVTEWNKAAEQIFEYSREEALGVKITSLIVSQQEKERLDEWWQSIKPGKGNHNLELASLTKGGRLIHCMWSIKELIDQQNNIIGGTATALDMTENKHAQENLLAAKEQAEAAVIQADRASDAKSQFLASMSHELRTPMNTVLGFSELLVGECTSPDHIQHAQLIHKAGTHLLDLINDILDLSKIEAGKLKLIPEHFQLHDLLMDCVKLLQPMAEANSIDIQYKKVECSVECFADIKRLKQCVLNLISNAIKYNQPGGSIKIYCEFQQDKQLRITVEDTGKGVPIQLQENLFEPFNRLGAENSAIQGCGIGLSITRMIIEMMGGDIGFQSIEGQGSRFWLRISVVSPGNADKADTDNVAKRKNYSLLDQQHTLLYVEDNPDNMHLMEQILKANTGLVLLKAVDAESAIEIAKNQQPALILMDINLPGMDGDEAMLYLKKEPQTKHIPIIALSANAMQSDIDKALSAGFDAYVTKPIDVTNLIDVLAENFQI